MTPIDPDRYALIADIGGTNTRVALARGGTLVTDTIRRYRNAEYDGLDAVLTRYLDETGSVNCTGVCVDLAGPVRDGVGVMTNLDWVVDQSTLGCATTSDKRIVINDMQAQAYALPALSPAQTPVLLDGPTAPASGSKLVVNVGTGFNAAVLLNTGSGPFVPPSECGHAALPVRDPDDHALAQVLAASHGFAAIEDALSGRGLERVYAFTAERMGHPATRTGHEVIAAAADGADPVAQAAVAHFCRLLGRVAGDLALVHLPFGGIYLVGGMARAVAPFARAGGFADAFRDKGRFGGFMDSFSVSVVEDDYAALQGCATHLACS